MREGGFIAKRCQRPALCGFDADGVDLDCAERIVDDLRVRCGTDRAIRADCDGQDGGNSDAHFGGCGIAADAAIRSGGQGNGRSASAARSVNRVGGRRADCKACHQADSENEGNDFLGVFHGKSPFYC